MSLSFPSSHLACGMLALVWLWGPAFAMEAECPAAPDPVISLGYGSRYKAHDDSRATLDPNGDSEVAQALTPLDHFIDGLADLTEELYRGPSKSRHRAANCILDQLAAWARADALSALETETVSLTVGARYSAFALFLWQTQPYAPDHPQRAAILDWLVQRMNEQVAFWPGAPEGARQGNLRAWAALAAAALSIQTKGDHLRDWAMDSLETVMCSSRPDGSLPQEMSRGRLALHYQLHAIAPLVTASVVLEQQGLAASRLCDNALHRIVSFAVSDLRDGRLTRAITGQEQDLFDGTDELDPHQLAWAEQYLLLESSEALERLVDPLRPLSYSKLGGNQTALWGR